MGRRGRGRDINPPTVLKLGVELSSYLHAAGEKSKRSLLTPVSDVMKSTFWFLRYLSRTTASPSKRLQIAMNTVDKYGKGFVPLLKV